MRVKDLPTPEELEKSAIAFAENQILFDDIRLADKDFRMSLDNDSKKRVLYRLFQLKEAYMNGQYTYGGELK